MGVLNTAKLLPALLTARILYLHMAAGPSLFQEILSETKGHKKVA